MSETTTTTETVETTTTTAVVEQPVKTAKVKKEKAVKVVKEPKVKESIEVVLSRAEAALHAKYPHVVKGSIWNVGLSEEYGQKRTVEVQCQYEGCSVKRRVATSDLHQAKYCPEHTRVTRLERRKEARAAKQATKPPKVAKEKKVKVETVAVAS